MILRLTGALVTDPSDASSTNAYDQAAGTWSDELIAAAKLPPALFPQIVPSTTVVGTVTADAAAQTGLRQGTPVVVGGGDGPMGALGAGVLDAASAPTPSRPRPWVSLPRTPAHERCAPDLNHVIGRYVPTAPCSRGRRCRG